MDSLVNVITIDGPVAAGKTVVGRKVARRLGYRYLDTGIMYRAVTWLAHRRGISMEDAAGLGQLARDNPVRLQGEDSDRVMIGGHELGPELRDPEVDRLVSLVARVSQVRRELVRQQRALAAEGNMVMVGRDIGTVVLPDADLKIFMLASPEERSRRRHRDLLGQGHQVDYAQVLQETRRRDAIDSQREDSPLQPAADAHSVKTDGRTAEQVVELILGLFDQGPGASGP
ncbi:MAG: (d)CMP kinase [Dehalococcoidia bacterium]